MGVLLGAGVLTLSVLWFLGVGESRGEFSGTQPSVEGGLGVVQEVPKTAGPVPPPDTSASGEAEVTVGVLQTHIRVASCVRAGDCSISSEGKNGENAGMWDKWMWEQFRVHDPEIRNPDFFFFYVPQYCWFHFGRCSVVTDGTKYPFLTREMFRIMFDYSTFNAKHDAYDYRLVVPLSYDFGRGTYNFGRNLTRLLEEFVMYKIDFLEKAIVLSPYGDTDTPFFDDLRDIVVPPYSPQTEKLVESFGEPSSIAVPSERRWLLFIAATPQFDARAPGLRRKVLDFKFKHKTDMLMYWQILNPFDYFRSMNSSKFCLVLPGMTGWTSRLFDSIYAGCIPVIVSHRTQFPFGNILTYREFSIQLDTTDVEQNPGIIEDTLAEISDADIVKLHQNCVDLRESFFYLDQYSGSHSPYKYITEELRLKRERLRKLGYWPAP